MTDKEQIVVVTYEEDRLNYFRNLMGKANNKHRRLFKKYKEAPYMSVEAEMLRDARREAQFLHDVVEALEKGYYKLQWISVEERLPDKDGRYLVAMKEGDYYHVSKRKFTKKPENWWNGQWNRTGGVRYWMPLPEPPKGENE